MHLGTLERPSHLLIGGALALLIVVWGSTWSVITVLLEGFPPLTGVAVRFTLAAMLLLVLARVRGVPLGKLRRERWLWLVQAVATLGIPYCVVFWAEQWVPSGLVAVLFATLPLFVIPVARILLPEERLHRGAIVGIAIGFSGVAVIFSEDFHVLGGGRIAFAAGLVLLAPFTAAIGQVTAKRWGQGIHSFSMTAVPMAIVGVGVGVLAAFVERGQGIDLAPRPIAAMVYLVLAGSILTFTVFYWVLQHLTSIQMSLITYAIPVVAVLIGTLLLGESLTPRILGGAVLVLSGVVFAARS